MIVIYNGYKIKRLVSLGRDLVELGEFMVSFKIVALETYFMASLRDNLKIDAFILYSGPTIEAIR